MKKSIALFLLLFIPWLCQAATPNQLMQLIDYVGVDYGGAVQDGAVVNPEEYGEMRDFVAGIRGQVAALPVTEVKGQLLEQARELAGLVEQQADPAEIKALTATMRQTLIGGYAVSVTPRQAPDLAAASALYAHQCAGCHGVSGQGDGPLAKGLNPPPTNFLDRERYRQRSLLGLYNTITQGLEGTAMQPHAELSEHERWGLAFYVGQLAASPAERTRGKALWEAAGKSPELARPSYFTTHSLFEIEEKYGRDGATLAAYLRAHPGPLFDAAGGRPLATSLELLAQSLGSYRQGKRELAYQQAVAAYLDGFELVEGNLDAVDPGLRRQIESAMTAYRNLIRQRAPLAEVVAQSQGIQRQIDRAQERMDNTSLSGLPAFVGALVILLREGLEALLVIAALAAFLVKTQRRDGLVYLYYGIAGALALGGLTWIAANTVIDISGTQRELVEGFAALFAALVLLSVGLWMHSKTSAVQWKHFIESSLKKHLGKGTLWGLAGLSFVAVYREMFEVVLFYQALWVQSTVDGRGMIVSGLLVALLLLLVLGWLILRYSTRLPLRQFFAVSGLFMFLLAFVFTGKGIAALQEAGKLPINPIHFPSFELLGIYPNLESLSIQAGLVLVALFLLWRSGRPNKTIAH